MVAIDTPSQKHSQPPQSHKPQTLEVLVLTDLNPRPEPKTLNPTAQALGTPSTKQDFERVWLCLPPEVWLRGFCHMSFLRLCFHLPLSPSFSSSHMTKLRLYAYRICTDVYIHIRVRMCVCVCIYTYVDTGKILLILEQNLKRQT